MGNSIKNAFQINQDNSVFIDLDDLQSGNNDYEFLINDTHYCDPTLPNVNIDGKAINSLSLWTDPRNPFISMSSKVQMKLNWKIQIIGNWSDGSDNIINCQVCNCFIEQVI